MTPQTSVIIPCYRVQEFLPEALESIARQTVPVREVILIDDGSPDPLSYPAGWNGPPLRLIRTTNRGLAAARNRGIAEASGEFVAFLDADDVWEPRKIEQQEMALTGSPSAVACYTRCVDKPGFFPFGPYPPQHISDDAFLLLLWYNLFFPPSSVMVRRTVLKQVGGFREDLGNGEDIELWLRLLTLGAFLQVAEPLCWYRQHAHQFTKNLLVKMTGSRRARGVMIALHAERLIRAGLDPDKLWDAYRNDILLVYYRRQFDAARWLLLEYWMNHRRDFRVLAYLLIALCPATLVTALRGRLQ